MSLFALLTFGPFRSFAYVFPLVCSLQYDGPDEDFLEMFIQFGYISMFSCVFPVAASLALLNNVIEIRADAFKLIHSFQRPFVHPTHNIGVWQVCCSPRAEKFASQNLQIALHFSRHN